MKIVLTSDIHWHDFKEFNKLNDDGSNFRLSLYRDSMLFVKDYCVKNGIEHWLDAGDIFHSRDSISTEVLDMLGKTLEDISMFVKLWFLKGNHDTSNRKGNITTLNILSKYGNIINERCIVPINGIDGPHVHFIPWDENITFKDSINNNEKVDFIVGHRMLNGSTVRGVPIDGETIKNIDETKFKQAFIGHVHEPQKLTTKIQYIGNLICSNFGENWEGSFLVYDTEADNIERIKNPYSPKFIKTNIEKIEDIPEKIEKNAFYEIKIVSNDTKELEKINENLIEKKDEFAGVRTISLKKIQQENRVDTTQILTPENLLEQYIKLNDLNEDIANIGREILKESEVF